MFVASRKLTSIDAIFNKSVVCTFVYVFHSTLRWLCFIYHTVAGTGALFFTTFFQTYTYFCIWMNTPSHNDVQRLVG